MTEQKKRKFQLVTETFDCFGTEVTIRELTQGERIEFSKLSDEDKFRLPVFLVSKGCIDPTFTEEEAADEGAKYIELIVDKVLTISNMKKDKATIEKQSNAG